MQLEKPVEDLNIIEASELIGKLLKSRSDGRNDNYIQTRKVDGNVDMSLNNSGTC